MWMTLQHYQVVWYLLTGAVLFLVAFTMGFDLGVTGLLTFLGRDNTQRRVMLNAVGSTWAGNQIWLVIAGGALFACWARVYGLVFSGFYIAMLLFLIGLFTRPIVFEWRAKVSNAKGLKLFDWALTIGSLFVAFAMGLLLGNFMQGVPFYFTAELRSFYTGNFFGLLNPFAILVGLTSLFMILMHGSSYLRMAADSVIAKRCSKLVALFSILFIICFAGAGLWIYSGLPGYHLAHAAGLGYPRHNVVQVVARGLLQNYSLHPWMLLAPLLGFVGALLALIFSATRCNVCGFTGSGLAALGALATYGASMFPFVVPSSTHPAQSMTVWNATSSGATLQIMFTVAIIMVPIMLIYNTIIYFKMGRRVTVQEVIDPALTRY